jgi:23S rRNA (guanosine2251-2'-O)-methyltransferase
MREWLYGRNPVYEALRAGRRHFFSLKLADGVQEKGRLLEIINICKKRKIPIQKVHRQQLEKIAKNNQGLALEASGFPYRALDEILTLAKEKGEDPFILILDTIQDPQNLGTLLRTAEIVGVHGVLLPKRSTATITPAVVNASSGASEHLLINQVNLAQAIGILKENDIWIIGLDGGDESRLPTELNLSGPAAVIVGNEGQGMRSLVAKSCDLLMKLPMKGQIESLNAASAGSIALYLTWQARGFK